MAGTKYTIVKNAMAFLKNWRRAAYTSEGEAATYIAAIRHRARDAIAAKPHT
jgi:hypothetical protein